MSIWSTIGKIGAGIAAPFTGGASLAAMPILEALGKAGPVLSGAAKGSADQRVTEGNQALQYGQLANQAARDRFLSELSGANAQFGANLQGSNSAFDAGMRGAQFARDGQDRQRKSAVLSSLLGGMQDASITGMNPKIAARKPTLSGGMRPSALTGNKDALMALLAQPEIAAPTYDTPAGYVAPSPYVAPALPTMPTAGRGENIMGGIGLGGSILGALGTLGRQAPPSYAGPTINRSAQGPRAGTLPRSPDLEELLANHADPSRWQPMTGGRVG